MQYNHQKHDRQSIRLNGYDYAQTGFYFITVCTQNHEMLFGEIKNSVMILNDYGEIICNEWIKTGTIRNNVKMDIYVVMPNHFHGIIEIFPGRGVSHTPTISHTKTNNRAYADTPLRSPSQTVGAIVRGIKSTVIKHINELRQTSGTKLWQRNYWEHIVRNENELNRIRQYIQNNPQKWQDDKLNNGIGNIVMEQTLQYGDEKWMI